jgi:hypothetical protein
MQGVGDDCFGQTGNRSQRYLRACGSMCTDGVSVGGAAGAGDGDSFMADPQAHRAGAGPIMTLLGAAWTGPVASDDGQTSISALGRAVARVALSVAALCSSRCMAPSAALQQAYPTPPQRTGAALPGNAAKKDAACHSATPASARQVPAAHSPIRPPRAIFLSDARSRTRLQSVLVPCGCGLGLYSAHGAICSEENSPCDTGPGALTSWWMTRCVVQGGHRPSHQACPAPDR